MIHPWYFLQYWIYAYCPHKSSFWRQTIEPWYKYYYYRANKNVNWMYVKREKVDVVISDGKFFLEQTLRTFKGSIIFLGKSLNLRLSLFINFVKS